MAGALIAAYHTLVAETLSGSASPDPLVSAIMCSFHRPHVLARAIESVLAQTLHDFELIVVDDGSLDGTPDIVRSFEDPRIRLVVNAKNLGLPASRNEGITRARGEFLAFLDDDDLWMPHKLERQVSALGDHPEFDAAWSYSTREHLDGTFSDRKIDLHGNVHRKFQLDEIMMMQPLLLRRSAIAKVGLFDPVLTALDDYEFSLRVSRHCRFLTVPEVLFMLHTTQGSMSRNVAERARMIAYLLEKPNTITGRRARARWMVRRSSDLSKLGRRTEWRRTLFRAIRKYPWTLKPWVMLVAGLLVGPKDPSGIDMAQ